MRYPNITVPYDYDPGLMSNTMSHTPSGTTLCHCYWHGVVGSLQMLSIKSMLATQKYSHKLILWLDPNSSMSPDAKRESDALIARHGDRFEIRIFHYDQEAAGSPMENLKFYEFGLCGVSDTVRFVLLYKYGGLWFDLDCLFMRDIGSTMSVDFVYAWANEPYANSAVFYIKNKDMMHKCAERAVGVGCCHPRNVFRYDFTDSVGLTVYPTYFFDPGWPVFTRDIPAELEGIGRGRWDRLFNGKCTRGIDTFYRNGLVFHWHNNWSATINEGTYAYEFNKKFDCELGLK